MGTTEYVRFTIADVNAGLADGWTFAAGWFAFNHVDSAWAWYRRAAPSE